MSTNCITVLRSAIIVNIIILQWKSLDHNLINREYECLGKEFLWNYNGSVNHKINIWIMKRYYVVNFNTGICEIKEKFVLRYNSFGLLKNELEMIILWHGNVCNGNGLWKIVLRSCYSWNVFVFITCLAKKKKFHSLNGNLTTE